MPELVRRICKCSSSNSMANISSVSLGLTESKTYLVSPSMSGTSLIVPRTVHNKVENTARKTVVGLQAAEDSGLGHREDAGQLQSCLSRTCRHLNWSGSPRVAPAAANNVEVKTQPLPWTVIGEAYQHRHWKFYQILKGTSGAYKGTGKNGSICWSFGGERRNRIYRP